MQKNEKRKLRRTFAAMKILWLRDFSHEIHETIDAISAIDLAARLYLLVELPDNPADISRMFNDFTFKRTFKRRRMMKHGK